MCWANASAEILQETSKNPPDQLKQKENQLTVKTNKPD